MTARTFYETIITVKLLSEDPIQDGADLAAIDYQMSEGDYVGIVSQSAPCTLDGKAAADLLTEYGSEPGFFRLDDAGNDKEDV